MKTQIKKWLVISKETQISVQAHESKKAAEQQAREMTKYHNRQYIVIERKQ